MRITTAAALLSTAALAACAAPQTDVVTSAASPEPVTLQILAINDFHGNLETPQSATTWLDNGEEHRARLGGAGALAGTLGTLRSENSVTVAAGDLIGASPLISALFLDEPAIDVLSEMGLDIASVGNHEFDRGTDELRRIQDGGCEQFTLKQPCAIGRFEGAGFSYLAGNVVSEDGASFFPGTMIQEMDGAQIGFIGLTLEGTPNLVSAQATEGYDFLDEADTANRLAAELRAQGADAVVLLLHEGANVDPRFNIAGCPSLNGSVVPIIERLDPSISLVVSGHTHQAYVCNVTSAAGHDVLLTSGGRYGGFVTDITMVVDPANDRVLSLDGRNVPVDGSMGTNATVDAIVSRAAEASGPVANRAVGPISDSGERGENCGDRPAQDFVADAYLFAANAGLDFPADVAFTNSGGVRSNLDSARDGVMTFGELAAMAPFGNSVIVLEMTGSEIRNVLEQQFCEENGQIGICDSVLIPSAGMAYSVDQGAVLGSRIASMTLNGEPIDDARTYRVVTNNFLVGGGDGFEQFSQVSQIANVGFDIDALEAYVATGTVSVPVCGRVQNVSPRN
ncbi:bifunctional metallophosphatase/5'-nucleotidase [Aurantiacibacter sp. D1-12]|uniref:bifunctional metallophosphatase/5'-nucleotidase n=1 Tax=Aurantiacibacter sp. D1-12 TaxID=2993658 RepID=UPI00237CFBAA|nr:bifunctional metallophosphatase/5'-nucleotidase [Aurantiacibacter sp. D1-12]MDE1466196.1 bifunctional metallophosphatase/5'-nucleotidase [Aurantiacibacter sp. D1-12]